MDCRNDCEKKLHDMVMDALHFMEKPRAGRIQFLTLMGEIRDAKVMLDNKQFGCFSGLHRSACECPRKVA